MNVMETDNHYDPYITYDGIGTFLEEMGESWCFQTL